MILKTIDHTNNDETNYYQIPNNVGSYIIERAGSDIYDPCEKFSEDFSDLLYLIATEYMESKENLVDITFHLC